MFVTKIYDMINLMYLFGIINISNFFIYLVTRVGRGSSTPHCSLCYWSGIGEKPAMVSRFCSYRLHKLQQRGVGRGHVKHCAYIIIFLIHLKPAMVSRFCSYRLCKL